MNKRGTHLALYLAYYMFSNGLPLIFYLTTDYLEQMITMLFMRRYFLMTWENTFAIMLTENSTVNSTHLKCT